MDARAQDRHDADCQQQPWERQQYVDHAHQDLIDAATEVPGHEAETDTDDDGNHDWDNPDAKRHPGADQDAAEDVSSKLVGT